MVDIFTEVEEDLRREQYYKLWKNYGRIGLGVFAGAILAVTAYAVWESHQQDVRREQSARYQDVMFADPPLEGVALEGALTKLTEEMGGGYKTLAQFNLAAAFVNEKKYPEAIALFEALAADSGADRSLRDVATIKAAALQAEVLTLDEMRKKLARLTAPEEAMRFSAGELLAYVAYRTGDLTAAQGYLTALRDDAEIPANARQRVSDMLAFIAGRGVAETGAPAAESAPEAPAEAPAETDAPGADETNQAGPAAEDAGESN